MRSEQESKTRKGGGESDGEDAPVLAKRVQLPALAEQVGSASTVPALACCCVKLVQPLRSRFSYLVLRFPCPSSPCRLPAA